MDKKTGFNKFLEENWIELVEHAEEMTGEKYDGLEPLLTKDEVVELAKELWLEEKNYEKNK